MALRVIGVMLVVIVLALIGAGVAVLLDAPQWAGVLVAFAAFGAIALPMRKRLHS